MATTTGTFDLVRGPNDDGSEQMAFVVDVVTRQNDGSKVKDPFCRSGNPPQFPNPVPATNVQGVVDAWNNYRSTLASLGFATLGQLVTRALTPAEVGDFRSVTLKTLSDMISAANAS